MNRAERRQEKRNNPEKFNKEGFENLLCEKLAEHFNKEYFNLGQSFLVKEIGDTIVIVAKTKVIKPGLDKYFLNYMNI